MSVNVHPISLGFDQCYMVQGEGSIMIDGGAPNKAKNFQKAMDRLSLQPEDIQLIVITHGHWDPIASATDIKKITGAKIAVHQQDQSLIETSAKPPPGVTTWGRILNRLLFLMMPFIRIPEMKIDIVLKDDEFCLKEYGIPGRVIHTPGHTKVISF